MEDWIGLSQPPPLANTQVWTLWQWTSNVDTAAIGKCCFYTTVIYELHQVLVQGYLHPWLCSSNELCDNRQVRTHLKFPRNCIECRGRTVVVVTLSGHGNQESCSFVGAAGKCLRLLLQPCSRRFQVIPATRSIRIKSWIYAHWLGWRDKRQKQKRWDLYFVMNLSVVPSKLQRRAHYWSWIMPCCISLYDEIVFASGRLWVVQIVPWQGVGEAFLVGKSYKQAPHVCRL